MSARIEHGGAHVDLVEIRPLLAIDLDRNKVAIEDLGHLLILEALVLHDVTPVAGGVPDAQEDDLVFRLRAPERLFTPGVPVDRIVRVLEEIRARLVDEGVGVLVLHGLSR